MSSSITVVFNAETGQYVANVQGMEKATARTAEASAAAKNLILAHHKELIESAKARGATTEELGRIEQKTAERLANVTESNANRQIATMNRVWENEKRIAAERAVLGNAQGASPRHGVSDKMAASSLVRGLENGNVGIRTVENFLTTLPGASAALQTFFSVAGPIAFAVAVGEGVSKVVELYRAAQGLPNAIARAFEAISQPMAQTGHDLERTNAQLELSIAHLEHRHGNTLALEIADARVEADKLFESANNASNAVEKLLKESKSGAIANLLLNKGDTHDVSREVQTRFNRLSEIERDRDKKVGLATTKDAKDAAEGEGDNRYQAALSDLQDYVRKTRATVNGTVTQRTRGGHEIQSKYSDVYGDQGSVNSVLNGSEDIADAMQITFNARRQNSVDTVRQKRDEDNNKGQEQANKAAEERLKAMKAELAAWKIDANVTLAAEFQFWQDRRDVFARGSEQYNQIVETQSRLAEEGARKAHELIERQKAAQKALSSLSPNEANHAVEWMAEYTRKVAEDGVRASEKLTETQRKNRDALADWSREQQVATGTLSRHDAAVQAAAEHAADYAAQLAQLDADEARTTKHPGMMTEEEQRRLDQIHQSRESITGQRDRAFAADQKSIYDATAIGGVTQALGAFTASALDTSRVLEQLTTQGLDAFNRAALATITGQNGRGKHAFADAGKGLATDVAGASLKGVEGMLLKGLGIGKGKPTGTASDPLHVVIGGIGAGAGALGNLGKDAGGWFGKLASAIHLPGFATGGAVSEGTMAMVGENGPEPVFFGDSARVMSNGDMRNALNGGGGGPTIHVDARGATDPAAVEAAAHRAVKAYIPGIVAASVGAGRNDNARRAPSQRN